MDTKRLLEIANEYLGDGLYARYDGYQICLMANSPTEPTDMVYLDPSVYANLQKFINRIAAQHEQKTACAWTCANCGDTEIPSSVEFCGICGTPRR